MSPKHKLTIFLLFGGDTLMQEKITDKHDINPQISQNIAYVSANVKLSMSSRPKICRSPISNGNIF